MSLSNLVNAAPLRGTPEGKNFKVGIVTALFNRAVTENLEGGAIKALLKAGVAAENIVAVHVPGAFEIPLTVKALMPKVDGVVALGAVIRGETTHYDYVCEAVERGCSGLALEFNKPVGFGVLTTENDDQAMARAGGRYGNKGEEAALVVLELCNLLSKLRT